MFLSFMNYFAIQCFPDTYNLVREGPNIDPHVTDLMVRAKKILGHEGRCGCLSQPRGYLQDRKVEKLKNEIDLWWDSGPLHFVMFLIFIVDLFISSLFYLIIKVHSCHHSKY